MRLTAGLIPCLTDEVISKLKSSGVTHVIHFLLKDTETLAQESGISYKDLQSIHRLIVAHNAAIAIPGSDLFDKAVKSMVFISTGIASLDKLLGGGLMTGEIVEFCGSWGVGKTSICSHLAVHAALKLGLRVLYIDSGANVTTNRLAPIIEKTTEEEEEIRQALSRIEVAIPDDIWGVFQVLGSVHKSHSREQGDAGTSSKKEDKIKLIILDSLPALMSPLILCANKVLTQLASSLKQIATEDQVVVVVVNTTVSANPINSSNQKFSAEPHEWRPYLGRYWAHVPNTRLLIDKTEEAKEADKIYIKRAPAKVDGADEHANETVSYDSGRSPSTLDMKVTVWKSSRLKIASTKVTLS